MTTPIHDQLTEELAEEHMETAQRIRAFVASIQPLLDELRDLEATLATAGG
jgi:hypothetical protein